MKTTTQVIKESNIPPRLIRAVIRQLGGKDSLPDIASHGIDGGFHGFICHVDTVAFFRRNRKEIVSLLEAVADDLGEDVITSVRSFGCFRHDPPTVTEIGRGIYGPASIDNPSIPNALAWFAAEEVARAFCDD